nr:hypothetical protein [Lewinella sp. JB7]
MYYWPVTPRLPSNTFTFLVVTRAGIGSLSAPDRDSATAALKQLGRGELPESVSLIPMHLLMRVQSYQGSTSLIVRQHAGKSRRFQLPSVACRDEAMRALRDHPAVKESNMLEQPLIERITPRLAACTLLSVLGWIGYEVYRSGDGSDGSLDHLSLGIFTELPFVLLPITLGLFALGAVAYTTWQSRQTSPKMEEVLFM